MLKSSIICIHYLVHWNLSGSIVLATLVALTDDLCMKINEINVLLIGAILFRANFCALLSAMIMTNKWPSTSLKRGRRPHYGGSTECIHILLRHKLVACESLVVMVSCQSLLASANGGHVCHFADRCWSVLCLSGLQESSQEEEHPEALQTISPRNSFCGWQLFHRCYNDVVNFHDISCWHAAESAQVSTGGWQLWALHKLGEGTTTPAFAHSRLSSVCLVINIKVGNKPLVAVIIDSS